jgi:hypothetical protein
MNNETIGISAELAIADYFKIDGINCDYRRRSDGNIIGSITNYIPQIFNCIPKPVCFRGYNQSSIDFILENGETLSVKTNKRGLGKVCPQNIGQCSPDIFWGHEKIIPLYNGHKVPEGYNEKSMFFKLFAIENIGYVIPLYLENLFCCDYTIHIYNIYNNNINFEIFSKNKIYYDLLQLFSQKEKYRFTQNPSTWKESCTIKYENVSIGEFQVHNNRKCYKFRFNMKGVTEIMKRNGL